jgi:UDP-N-acetylmuramate dehydrogenase
MEARHDFPLSTLTTLRLGGPARRLVEAESPEQVVEAVAAADRAEEPLLLIAGGSNLVIADAGWQGSVVALRSGGGDVSAEGGRARLTVAAGENWDDVVARCVEGGLAGVECLSGIPGSTGATPIQNVGAYGQEVAETVVAVRAYDRATGETVELAPEQCAFGYRTSAFKGADRYVVLDVGFELERSETSGPIAYAQLADQLGVAIGATAPLTDVRAAVLALRRSKGMVVDPDDPDSVSAGSFFTNPVLSAEQFESLQRSVAERLGSDVSPPGWPEPDGRVKTSAAWLLQRAGFGPGYGDGRAGVSAKHSLALVNRGGATTAELLEVARELRDGVRTSFGVELVPEPTLVGVEL